MNQAIPLVVLSFAWAAAALAQIKGSKHDFTAAAWAQGQPCVPCHLVQAPTARDALGNSVTGVVWNRALPPASGYRMYVGGTIASGQELDTTSLLCMSCHDGAIALDSFSGACGSVFIGTGAGANPRARFGSDLTGEHPVGAAGAWPTAPHDSALVDPVLRERQGIMPLGKLASSGRPAVGCRTCHDPHNIAGNEHMLWVRNSGMTSTVDGRTVSGSGLCFNCHKI